MSSAKKCDVCGKLYKPYTIKHKNKGINGIVLAEIDNFQVPFVSETLDCCFDCMKEILKMIEVRNAKKNKTEEELSDGKSKSL